MTTAYPPFPVSFLHSGIRASRYPERLFCFSVPLAYAFPACVSAGVLPFRAGPHRRSYPQVLYSIHTSPTRQRCLMHARKCMGRVEEPKVPMYSAVTQFSFFGSEEPKKSLTPFGMAGAVSSRTYLRTANQPGRQSQTSSALPAGHRFSL